MILMNSLRMLADGAFYGAFAGLIAVKCGGSGAFLGMLLQCLCFGLSWAGREKRGLRLLLLLPMALGWVPYRHSLADCVLLLPTAAYILWLVWKGDYALDRERRQTLFGAFWKLLLVFVPLAMLMGCTAEVTAATMPYALAMLASSVLLMRALRHEPKTYCGKKYQLVNASAVALAAALAGLISSKPFLRGCAAVLKAAYSHVLQPVLELLLNLVLAVLWGVSRLFSWLSLGGTEGEEETVELDMTGAGELFGEDFQQAETAGWVGTLGWVLLIAAAIAVLALFFRWLSRRGGQGTARRLAAGERESVPAGRRGGGERETSPVRRIRALYRSFLKWSAERGMEPRPGDTSLDVHELVSAVTQQGPASARVRELYIKARYAGQADPEAVREMKVLCGQLKKLDS